MEGLSLRNIYNYEEYQVQLVLEKLTIQAIEKIEKNAPEFNPATLSWEDNVNALLYYQQYGNEYKTLVHDCGDVLPLNEYLIFPSLL